jgi:hypothetical protein
MQRAFDLDTWKMKGPYYNDSRRTVRSMALTKRHDIHDLESQQAHATHKKSRAVSVLRCETRIVMQR